jgi:uncharacterized protein YjdB
VSNAAGTRGEVTAIAAGTSVVTAAVSGIVGTATVNAVGGAPQKLEVKPAVVSKGIGDAQQFTATAIYANNVTAVVTAQCAWSTSAASVASIDSTGKATGIAAGAATITATYQGVAGTASLTISGATLQAISVTPIAPSVQKGSTRSMVATGQYSDGSTLDLTQLATWTSSAPNVADVSNNAGSKGLLTAITQGSAQITAAYQGVTGTTTVTVNSATVVSIQIDPSTLKVPIGVSDWFTATAIMSDNSSIDVTWQAQWTSSAPSVADVGNNPNLDKGVVTSQAAGVCQIRATYGGVTGTSAVTVTAATITAVQVTPSTPSVAKGSNLNMIATAVFSDNSTTFIKYEATWTSSNATVASVGNSYWYKGWLDALNPGTATISATWHGVTGATTVTVTAATLNKIQITPFAPKLPVGFQTYLQATGIYSDNTTQDLTYLASWTSSDPAVASVSWYGRLTPSTAGSATISATYGGVTGTDAVTVSSATLSSISISPATTTIAVQQTKQLLASGTFSDGSVMDVTEYVTWLSSSPTVADVSNAIWSWGQAKGLAPGSTTITAVRGTVQGTAAVTVQ